jgi:hypothetical protein
MPFVAALLVGMGSSVLAVAELVASYLLRDMLFGIGPIALRHDLDLSPPTGSVTHQRIKLRRVQLRVIGPTRAIFSARYVWPPQVGANKTAGPIKGTIAWAGSRAEIVVRHPLGPIAFAVAWLVCGGIGAVVTLGAAVVGPRRIEALTPLFPLLLVSISGYAMYRFALWRGHVSAKIMTREVVSHLQGRGSFEQSSASGSLVP